MNNRGFRGRGFRGGRQFHRGNTNCYGNRRGGNNTRTYNQGGQFGHNKHINQTRNKSRDTPGKRLSEEEIGVTEFISEQNGFSGIIKHRLV